MEYGLIGERLGHSYSERIHHMLGDYDYRLCPMPPEDMRKLLAAREFRGLNVTIPYKRDVLAFCDELADEVRKTGSANTLVKRGGVLTAYNTDLGGFAALMRRAGVEARGRKVAILGSGGAARAARAACGELGAREIVIVSRTGPVNYEALYREHKDAQVLVNATPVGMYPDNLRAPTKLDGLDALEGVIDLVYNPDRSLLVLEAQERGLPARGGLWMLVTQARLAAEKFLDRAIDPERCEQIYAALRAERLNLVLVGMPGSGKSTLARALKRKLGRKLVDLDEEIEREAGMSVAEIFAAHGEDAFRRLESEAVQKYGKESGLVIAAGGGAPIRRQNAWALRQNGVVLHVTRPVEKLATQGRPLSGGIASLKRMEAERLSAYRACADARVDNSGALETAVVQALEAFSMVAGM